MDGDGLIQGLGFSLGTFDFLIHWLGASKTTLVVRLWLGFVDLEKLSKHSHLLLSIVTPLLSIPNFTKFLFSHHLC
jgi:hypothetical protein